MTIRNFIFSPRVTNSVLRHSMFWTAYVSFFYIQSIVPSDYSGFLSPATYRAALFSVLHFLPVCVLSVYLGLYFIQPAIESKKLTKAILLAIGLFMLDIFINYFFSARFNAQIVTNIDAPIGFNIILGLGYLNSIWAIVATGIVLGIRISKNWVLQQRQLLELNSKRLRTDVDIRKGEVLPDFLLSTLDSLHRNITAGNKHSPELVILLSDVLSYTLYDAKQAVVEVRKEILVLQKFAALVNSSAKNLIQLEIDAKSNFSGRYIIPLSLLSLIQHCIYALSDNADDMPFLKVRLSSSENELRVRVFSSSDKGSGHWDEIAISRWLIDVNKDPESVRIRKMHKGLLICLAFQFVKGYDDSGKIINEQISYA